MTKISIFKKLNPKGKRGKYKPEFWLLLIVLFALALRMWFFVGLINADPQDDGIYIFYIRDIVEGKHDITYFADMVSLETINPVHTFKLRSGFLFPEAFFVKLLGYNQLGYTIYPLLSSLLVVTLAYYFGKNILKSEKIGLISSLLVTFYPLDIIFSTKISPDVPLALFASLSIYFLIIAFHKKPKKKVCYLLSGFFAAVASTIKTFGIILFPVIGLLLLYYFLKSYSKKHMSTCIFCFILGFLSIFLMNEIYFYTQTQTFLLEPTVNRKTQLDNFKGFSSVHKLIDNFNVLTTYGEPIEYLKLIFGLKENRPGVNYFGYFYFTLLLSSLLFLTFKKIKKENMAIFIWLIAGFLVLEFFPIGVILENNEVNYLLIPKEGRFMSLLTIPTMLIISSSLTAIGKKLEENI